MDGRANRRLRDARARGRLRPALPSGQGLPLFPSDLEASPEHLRILVAGRVLVAAPESLVLADAFARVSVRGAHFSNLSPGDLVVVEGTWTGRALEYAILTQRTPSPVPHGHGEFARLTFEGVGPRLRARARALSAMRAYFDEAGFIEVETPYQVPEPGVDRNVEAIPANGGFLITSPELEMKRLIVGGIPRQYQLARVSRQDEAGALHEQEFTLLEWYRAFASFDRVLSDAEQIVLRVARAVTGRAALTAPDGRTLSAQPPFERISIRDAFRKYAGIEDASDLAASDEDRYFELLVGRVEPALSMVNRPVFLFDYPISEAALARPNPRNFGYAERFELYAGGIELCNGYGELVDALEQRRRFLSDQARRREEHRPVYPLNERFLKALEEGMPASAGNALGVDRLVLLATGAKCIQDVMAVPRARL